MTMNLKSRPIGVFDSGIGGLTAVSELRKILPNEDIIYLGDTARVPYGTRSPETILRYASQDFEFLKKSGVKYIIAACGTVSSVIVGNKNFPDDICTGVILPTVEAACKATKNGRIGVIATGASIKSGNYERLIKEKLDGAKVYSKACPMFVPLVENGYIGKDCRPTVEIAKEYLEPLKSEGIDTLILGCTHYPLLTPIISEILGPGVQLINSGAEAARHARDILLKNGLLSDGGLPGEIRMYCTDSTELFRETAARFIDIDGIKLERCSVEG